MSDLRSYEPGHLIGISATPTDRTSRSTALKAWGINPGGNTFEGAPEITDIPTEHKFKGNLYSLLTKRNNQARTITGPFPVELGSLINLCGTNENSRNADGLPKFGHIRRAYGDGNLGTSVSGNSASDLGEDIIGISWDSLSFDLDRNDGTVIELALGGYLNADRRVPGATTTTADVETSGANKVLTLASATGFAVGDSVRITDTVAGEEGVGKVTVVSGSDITIDDLPIDIDGSGTPVQVRKVIDLKASDYPANLYPHSNVYVDVDVDRNGWTGDNEDVQRASFQYQLNGVVRLHRPSNDADLNQTWSKRVDGTPTCNGNIQFVIAQDAYTDFKRSLSVRKLRIRAMGFSPESDATTTSAALTYSASAQTSTISVLDSSDFVIGQCLLLNDGTNQCVVEIKGIPDGTTVTATAVDCDIASGADVNNTAWQFKVLNADITASPQTPDGENYIVDIQFAGKTDISAGEVVQTCGYDHVYVAP